MDADNQTLERTNEHDNHVKVISTLIRDVENAKGGSDRCVYVKKILEYLLEHLDFVKSSPEFCLAAREKCREFEESVNNLVCDDEISFEFGTEILAFSQRFLDETKEFSDFEAPEVFPKPVKGVDVVFEDDEFYHTEMTKGKEEIRY